MMRYTHIHEQIKTVSYPVLLFEDSVKVENPISEMVYQLFAAGFGA